MCSMLDAIVDQPMEHAITGLQLRAGVRDALLGSSNAMRSILDAVITYEQGDWDRAGEMLKRLGLPKHLLAAAYADALRWVRELSSEATP
jgi:c-di-GMP-related signal transduction protein